jgi:two-component system sensor histidine kinase AlgZ
VILRAFLVVNALASLTVLIATSDMAAWFDRTGLMLVMVESPLCTLLLVLFLFEPQLSRQPPLAAWTAIAIAAMILAAAWHELINFLAVTELWRSVLWSVAAVGCVRFYFQVRAYRLSPSLSEARLLALTARIRPHFLFNSLNGVLGIIRSDPRRAEHMLEEVAELFRGLVRDNRQLVTLEEELVLCRRYLEVERLRLGDRLDVRWTDADAPLEALIPPLTIQPLLENAVYYGVEPCDRAAPVDLEISCRGGELRIKVSNVRPAHRKAGQHEGGNRTALNNLRERLMLFFDLEAGVEVKESAERFEVLVRLPYKRAAVA